MITNFNPAILTDYAPVGQFCNLKYLKLPLVRIYNYCCSNPSQISALSSNSMKFNS